MPHEPFHFETAGLSGPLFDALNDLTNEFGARAGFFARIQPDLPFFQQQFLEGQFGRQRDLFAGDLGRIILGGGQPGPGDTFQNALQARFSPQQQRQQVLRAPSSVTGLGTARSFIGPTRTLTQF